MEAAIKIKGLKNNPCYLVLLLFMFCQSTLFSQGGKEADDASLVRDKLKELTREQITVPDYSLQGEKKHLRLFLKVLLLAYKKGISEQLSTTCEFDLGCSSFSWKAIESTGIVRGLLLSADRLTRCNGRAGVECEPLRVNHETENAQPKDILIYPNPFTLQTTLSFNKEIKNATLKIMNVLGKEVRSINFSGSQFVIEKGELNPGVYFVQLVSMNELIANKKMVIQ